MKTPGPRSVFVGHPGVQPSRISPPGLGPRLPGLRWPVDRDPAQADLQPVSLDLRDLLRGRSGLVIAVIGEATG